MNTPFFRIAEEPIQVEEVIGLVRRREAGAVTVFMGTVREWTEGVRTSYLDYDAYQPMAVKMMERIGAEVQEHWPHTSIAMAHRVGRVAISDIAVVIAVSSPHRKEAYEASQYAIDRIKEIVPIWKEEGKGDGA